MNKTHKIVLAALFAALSFVFTYFIHIPLPGTGYFNLGDTFILLSAILIDPYTGILVALSASILSDALSGFAVFIPFTIIAKTLEALIAGLMYKKLKGSMRYTGIIIGPLLMVIVYAFSYLILFDVSLMLASVPFDLLQAGIAITLTFLFIKVLERTLLLKSK